MLDRIFSLVRVTRKLILGKNATLVTTSDTGVESIVNAAELGALDVTAGTATAGKALVLNADKGIATITSATITTGTLTNANLGGAAASLVGFHGIAGTAMAGAYTQTYSTADKTHAALTATAIAAADAANAAAATATSIAAAVPAEPPNVDEDGIAAGGFITRAARRTLVQAVIDLRTHAVEMDLDYEALLVDVADIRTKYAVAVTLANELKVDYTALLADVTNVKQLCNSIIDDLQAKGLVG